MTFYVIDFWKTGKSVIAVREAFEEAGNWSGGKKGLLFASSLSNDKIW